MSEVKKRIESPSIFQPEGDEEPSDKDETARRKMTAEGRQDIRRVFGPRQGIIARRKEIKKRIQDSRDIVRKLEDKFRTEDEEHLKRKVRDILKEKDPGT